MSSYLSRRNGSSRPHISRRCPTRSGSLANGCAVSAKADASGAVAWSALASQPLAQPLAQPVDAQGNPLKDADGKNLSCNPGTAILFGQQLAAFISESQSRAGHLNGGGPLHGHRAVELWMNQPDGFGW